MNTLIGLLFATSTLNFGLPPYLLNAVCWTESRYNVHAIHLHDGQGTSVGICQIKLKTARWMGFKGSLSELQKPDVNIHYAAKYLSYNLLRYHGNIKKALVAYNMGNAKKFNETAYSKKVIKKYNEFKQEDFYATQ